MRRGKGTGGQFTRTQGAAGIEPEPAYPQQAGPNQAKHHAMRRHRLMRIARALAQHQSANQSRCSRTDVNHSSSSEVQDWHLPARSPVKISAFTPYHVRQWKINERCPKKDKKNKRAKTHSFGESATDQSRR